MTSDFRLFSADKKKLGTKHTVLKNISNNSWEDRISTAYDRHGETSTYRTHDAMLFDVKGVIEIFQ